MYRRRGDERGVAAVIFALMLTALLSMSALAIDVGAAYTERRHDQNTVDAAVMSAAVEAVLGGGVIDKVVLEVRDKVDTTLGKTVTDAEWAACVDNERLKHTAAAMGSDPATQCISFSSTFEEIRVKLPVQKAMAVFGPALGFGELTTTASANARIQSVTGGLPFVALSTATKGDFVCLRTSSAKTPLPLAKGNGPGTPPSFPETFDLVDDADPCHSEAFSTWAENFGTLLPWQYDDCTQQTSDTERAISIGIDHPMGIFPRGYDPVRAADTDAPDHDDWAVRLDGGSWNNCTTGWPNTFKLTNGLNANGLSCALLNNEEECNDVKPRLQNGPFAVEHEYELIGIDTFDNKAPWEFLLDPEELATRGAPSTCVAVAESVTSDAVPSDPDYWDHYDRFDTFRACLSDWGQAVDEAEAMTPVIFDDSIGESARFGFVPKVAEDTLKNMDVVHVEGFVPIFMYRMYIQQDSGPMCDEDDPRANPGLIVHDAGQEFSCGDSNKRIDRLASVILACGMVSDKWCNKTTEEPKYAGKDIYEFRLVK